MSVDFRVIVRQVDIAAIGVAVGQLRRVDRHRSVTKQHEVTSRRAVIEVVSPDVASLRVLLTVRRHTAHRNVVVLSHVPHCIRRQKQRLCIGW